MQNPAAALHTAARRYCMERERHWRTVYAALPRSGRARDGYHYTPEALDTFPRYNVLHAILAAVEAIDPESLADFGAAKALLLDAGSRAEDAFTRSPLGDRAAAAQAEERARFQAFVAALTEADSLAAEPLPYRRVLTPAESERIWAELDARWGVQAQHYWSPTAPDTRTFAADAFAAAAPIVALRDWLRAQGLARVWELREYGPEYEEAVELFDPRYNGAEGYWTAPGCAWTIHASHDGVVVVAGELLAAIEKEERRDARAGNVPALADPDR